MIARVKSIFSDLSANFNNVGILLLIPLLIIGAAISLYQFDPLALQAFRNTVFDQYQRWQPRHYHDTPVRIVDIDEESLQKYGQWPWPRILLADLLNKLRESQPKAIAFDMVFAEPDRTSPQAMLKFWRANPDLSSKIAQLPDHDGVFAAGLRQGGTVLGFIAEQNGLRRQKPLEKSRYILKGDGEPKPYQFSGALKSLEQLEAAADGNGALNFMSVADGVVRRVPLILRMDKTLLPSLSAETLRIEQQSQNYMITSSRQANGLEQLQIGRLLIPITNKGEIWVHYTRPVAERYIPAWKILSGAVPPEALSEKILLVGASAKALEDMKLNSLGDNMPGIEAHAQAIEQILRGEFISRPDWADAVELPALIIGGLLASIVTRLRPIGVSTLFTFALIALLAAAGWLAFSCLGLLFDLLTPGLAILLIYALTGAVSHFASEKRNRWLRQAFSRYVSPNRVEDILKHPEKLELGGQRRQCSFIFTDLAGFTDLMESVDPAQAVAWLNTYLDGMIAIAFKHYGTLDRIVGDAVAILFSAPIAQAGHQQRALLCALEMHAFAVEYSRKFQANGVDFGQTRIGVHSGEVIVGNFGGAAMFDYRALGDPVNTASRLESANKYLGTLICVSAATLAACTDIPARPIGKLLLKGKKQALMTYQPFPPGTAEDSRYQAAYALLAAESAEALPAFTALAGQRPEDPLVQLHLKRLQTGQRGELIVMEGK